MVLILESENLKPLEGNIYKANMVFSFDKETDPSIDLEKFHFVENKNEVVIDGVKATQRLVSYSAGHGKRYSTVFKKEGRGYYEVVSYEADLFPTAKSVYDQILSTFKFAK